MPVTHDLPDRQGLARLEAEDREGEREHLDQDQGQEEDRHRVRGEGQRGDQGVADGATCWQPQVALPARGFYYPPTLLSNVHPTSIVAQQEIFGPVLAAMTFRTPAEAVELANNTVYGLAACVWSESVNVALHVAAQLKAGVVWVNCTNLFDASCGFGGYRESGYGREGGFHHLDEYLNLKAVWINAS